MTGTTPTPASPPDPSGPYTDAQAMDDIQALLASRSRSKGEDAVDEITEIVERTGRPVITPRLISAGVRTAENGLPYAFVNAESTFVRVEHDASSDAIAIDVRTVDEWDRTRLTITLDSRTVVPAQDPPGGTEGEPRSRDQALCPAGGNS